MSCFILENGNIGICVKMVKYGLGKDGDAATARFSHGMTNEEVAFESMEEARISLDGLFKCTDSVRSEEEAKRQLVSSLCKQRPPPSSESVRHFFMDPAMSNFRIFSRRQIVSVI